MTPGSASLPQRSGLRPRTTPTNPHMQLEQQPLDDRPRRRLEALLTDLPGVVWAGSLISVPGARALTLPPDQALGPPEAFMIGTEFAHLHPAPDHSLHVALPPEVARQAIEAGWAEQHPIAARGLIPPGSVMIYAPRDDDEADVVAHLVTASYDHARGAASPETG
ncbi:MAG: DUF5519 family protein [Mycobacteriales bacterium]|nr:DUF5519 family protein [Mycobacteriales bacterium]